MIVLAGVVVQLILGHMGLVTPVMMAPIASKHDGINIVSGDSCIELKLFSLLLYFP